ncbi:hypothetical protein Tco_1059877 [Tanacetum coccineum]
MVAFLSKLAESKGFEQILDFLNAHPIKHALTVNPTIYTSCIEQLWATVKAKNVNGEVQLQALVDRKKIIIIELTVRKDLHLEDAEGVDCLPNATIFEQLALMRYEQSSGPTEHVADEAVYKELDDSLVRAATTASSLEAEQGSGNTLRSGKDSLKLKELMELCTNLQTRVLDLETTKTTQANEIDSLKRRVKRLEKKKRSRTHGLKRLYKVGLSARVESFRDEEDLGEDASKQGRINAIDADEDITLVNDQDDADMFDVNTLTGDEVLAEPKVVVKDVNLILMKLLWLKHFTKVSAATTTTTAIIPTPRKGIVITKLEEPVKPKKKDLIRLDEDISSKLQAEFDEEERLTREKDDANVALTEEWDGIQAKVKVDYQLAQRLQAQEQEELTNEEKARLFVQFLEQRRKHFAAKRAEEKRNKPPTQAQQRKIMSGDEVEQEVTKKQKVDDVQEIAEVDDDQETTQIKELMKIVSDEEEIAIDAIPLATKPPSIVD